MKAQHKQADCIPSPRREIGEVWTPPQAARNLLNMFDKAVWQDTESVFFEPTCGHGNFVIEVLRRRLSALLNKAKKESIKEPHLYSAANALNTLWAIDIDSENIRICRKRTLEFVFNFLKDYEFSGLPEEPKETEIKLFIRRQKDFFIHILCCIEWQIHKNELLSSLKSNPESAERAAGKTAISRQWFKQNEHRPIDFKETWIKRFERAKGRSLYESNQKKLSLCLNSPEASAFLKSYF